MMLCTAVLLRTKLVCAKERPLNNRRPPTSSGLEGREFRSLRVSEKHRFREETHRTKMDSQTSIKLILLSLAANSVGEELGPKGSSFSLPRFTEIDSAYRPNPFLNARYGGPTEARILDLIEVARGNLDPLTYGDKQRFNTNESNRYLKRSVGGQRLRKRVHGCPFLFRQGRPMGWCYGDYQDELVTARRPQNVNIPKWPLLHMIGGSLGKRQTRLYILMRRLMK